MTMTDDARKTTAKKAAKRKQPQDYKQKAANATRAEQLDEPVTFKYDGDSFTFTPRDATGLEFMAALEDEELIAACRMLLGHEQATKLFTGRTVEDLAGFFDAMGAAVGSGNP